MLTKIRTIIDRVNNETPKRRYKILCTPIHEAYQTSLGLTGHEFHMIQGQNIKQWNFNTKPLPDNHYLYLLTADQFRGECPFDLILSQERYSELQRSIPLGQQLGIPVVHIDHTEPPPGLSEKRLDKLIALRADKHCFITEHNKQSWHGQPHDTIITHGINTDLFSGWAPSANTHGVSVVNHIASRDVFCGWGLFQKIAVRVPIQLVGENPGMSESAKTPEELVNSLRSARFYLNTSQLSPCPLSLLEASSVGIPIVSTANQEVPKIFTHGKNAFLSNDPEELIKYCQILQNDIDICRELGNNARQLIVDNFGMDKFVSSWNNVFDEAYLTRKI